MRFILLCVNENRAVIIGYRKECFAGGDFGEVKTESDLLGILARHNVNGVSKIQLETPFLEPSKNDIDRKVLLDLDSIELKKKKEERLIKN